MISLKGRRCNIITPHICPFLWKFFSDYLLGNRNLAMESLREMGGLKSYTEWRDYLRNDPLLLEDNRLSELIVLASLKYLYYDSRFKANEVRKYLTH